VNADGTVLIAGAGLAGARVAETLRALGRRERIVLAGDEPHAPYERPALSKEFLAGEREDVSLRPLSFWRSQRIELRRGQRVERVDLRSRTAVVGREHVRWDALVVATGARAKPLAGALTLRTLHDARTIAHLAQPSSRVVIVGGGFVGAEVASTLAPRVAATTIVEPGPQPFHRALGEEVGAVLAARYRGRGVLVVVGAAVRSVDPARRRVVLADGRTLAADLVVAGIGATAAGELLGGGAVATDSSGRTGIPGIYACGDVALWNGRRGGHWTGAAAQARAVAHAIAGEEAPYDGAAYFWSEQFGLRLQHVSRSDTWSTVDLDGDEGSFTARYLDRDGQLVGALAANRADAVARLRRELAA
jgi:NADPH-dependent 2,4-dienoyl-CoA reductase/sulfur reductase-like enzyme